MVWKYFLPFYGLLFHPLLYRSLLVGCSPICLGCCCFVICVFSVISKKSLPRQCHEISPMFSSRMFIVSDLMVKCLIHFSWFLCRGWDMGPNSLFCMQVFSFPSTICWRDYPFSTACPRHLCHRSVGYTCVVLFLVFLFCSIGLYVPLLCQEIYYFNSHSSIVFWKQKMWYFQLCSFSSLFWLFGMFCASIQILRIFVYFCEKYVASVYHWVLWAF